MTGLCLASCGTKPQTATEGADAFNYVVDQASLRITTRGVFDVTTQSYDQDNYFSFGGDWQTIPEGGR